ncbi:enoyl-CoA hydratase-related protein, partial [Oleiphilus sp. HI0117]
MTDRIILERVRLEIKDQIAYVTLVRASKLNALDIAMFEAIAKVAKELKKNKSIRAVILSGDGDAFCSGLDIKSVLKSPVAALKLLVKPGTKASNLAQDVSYLWRDAPVPVIAVTHGKCWGGGFQIALGADFRYSTPDCEFSIMEARWGLIPDMGGTLTLREL